MQSYRDLPDLLKGNFFFGVSGINIVSIINSKGFRGCIFGRIQCADTDAIEFYFAFHWDHQAFAAVDDTGFYQVCTVRCYVDHNVRGFDLEFSGVGDVGCHQGGFFACGKFVLFIEVLEFFVFYAAFFEEAFDLGFGEDYWFWLIFLGFDKVVEFFVDLKNGVVGAVIAKGFFYQCIKGVALGCCGQWCGAAEDFFHHGGAEVFGVFCVVEEAVDVGAAVVELWEEEAPVGHFYQPVADAVFDVVGLCVVVQACLGEFDRADAAEDVVVDLIGGVEYFGSVGGFAWDVVDCVDEDDVVIFAVVVVFDDLVVEGFGEGVVGEFAFAEFHEEVLGSTFGFLVQGEFHVDEVFADGTGEGFAEDVEVFEGFFFGQG